MPHPFQHASLASDMQVRYSPVRDAGSASSTCAQRFGTASLHACMHNASPAPRLYAPLAKGRGAVGLARLSVGSRCTSLYSPFGMGCSVLVCMLYVLMVAMVTDCLSLFTEAQHFLQDKAKCLMNCLRSFRVCNLAALDTVATLGVAVVLGFGVARLLGLRVGGALAITAAAIPVMFGAGMLAHQMSGTPTPLNRAFGLGGKVAPRTPAGGGCEAVSAVAVFAVGTGALWLSYTMMKKK